MHPWPMVGHAVQSVHPDNKTGKLLRVTPRQHCHGLFVLPQESHPKARIAGFVASVSMTQPHFTLQTHRLLRNP